MFIGSLTICSNGVLVDLLNNIMVALGNAALTDVDLICSNKI